MEIFVDRRNERHARINTDRSVELVHEDFEEPFEADCVDLSPGGAAVRASCLPEVGASFICRFEGNGTDQSVEVPGTVVWAHLEGDRKGEFGLRFLDVDEPTEEVIAAILRKSGMEKKRPPGRDAFGDGSFSHLYLDGVSAPIAARITQCRNGLTTFEQELALLRIERGVSAWHPGGRPKRGTIAGVQLRVEDDTPKLVITIRHRDGAAHDGGVVEPDEAGETVLPPGVGITAALDREPEPTFALEPEVASAPEPAIASEPEPEIVFTPEPELELELPEPATAREDRSARGAVAYPEGDTFADWKPVIDALDKSDRLRLENAAPQPTRSRPEPERSRLEPERSELARPERVQAGIGTAGRPQNLFELGEDDEDVTWPPDRAGALPAAIRANRRLFMGALARLKAVMLPALGSLISRFRDQALPALLGGASSARQRARGFWQGRALRLPLARARGFRLPRLFQRKRRTTAFIASGQRSEKNRSRTVGQRLLSVVKALLLPALAIGGGLLAAYGFGTWWSGEGNIPLHRLIGSQSRTEREDAPRPEPASRESAPDTEINPALSASMASDLGSEAIGAPTSVEQRAAAANEDAEATSPAAAPEEKPAPQAKREGDPARGVVFGSRKLAGGRDYLLRMSRKIEELRGTPDPGGFTVIIPGSLSFDPAGPIAATHPLVRRSLILNKGDHAALTIRFAKGVTPAYRVSAVGSSLYITIAESG